MIPVYIENTRKWKYATPALMLVFAVTVFAQCIIFHVMAFHYYYLSSFVHFPAQFWAFYLPKISIAVALAAFVPLFRKKGWTVIASILISVWCFSELVYYRVNLIFLDAYSFTMVGNMKGFWNGVISFMRWGDLWFVVFPVIVFISYYIFKSQSTSYPTFSVTIAVSVILSFSGMFSIRLWIKDKGDLDKRIAFNYNPFSRYGAQGLWCRSTSGYIKFMSVCHSFFYECYNLLCIHFSKEETAIMNSEEEFQALQLCNIGSSFLPSSNLYIILFESFENWAITGQTTPNICEFIDRHDNILWAQKVTRQTKGGTSADGQMIVNTGVLPISEGAVCFRYPNITFPSLSSIYYSKSAMIQPGDMSIWNQKRMSDAYHIAENYVITDNDDYNTFSRLSQIYQKYTYVLAVSMASHAPFKSYLGKIRADLNPNMPYIMGDYLNCVHYTDACLAGFLNMVDNDETLKNATIVITGDHTIFDESARLNFSNFCSEYNVDYKVGEAYVPLIIYSPAIKQKKIIDTVTYQMDIFPTILHCIGCDSTYYWKGFGVNLCEDHPQRKITPEKAFILSEKMIKSDFWSRFNN